MRKWLFVMILSMFLICLASGNRGTAEAAEPIKIGYLAPYVGVFAKFGSDLRDGFKLYRLPLGKNRQKIEKILSLNFLCDIGYPCSKGKRLFWG